MKEALLAAWHGQSSAAAYQDYTRNRQARLAMQATLTDFRLYWDALAQALVGREKIIIDADQVPGRRHLLLIDPEQLRSPFAGAILREGNPSSPRPARSEPPSEGP